MRFIGDAGFVVTFRQTDPLYAVDLSDPRRPRVRGELKILGYSAYLHPVGGDLLLGVGQDATEQGAQTGTQLSLFDVSDLSKPARLHARSVGQGSSSAVEFDHHAFLWWAPAKLAVVPVEDYGSSSSFVGAIGFGVTRGAGIGERGRASHEGEGYATPILRSFVVKGRLFTLSDSRPRGQPARDPRRGGRGAVPAAVAQLGFGLVHGAARRASSSAPSSAMAMRVWSSESRSRRVTVSSSIVWWSTVTPHGVPISSWRR